jgi:hypothetical protein
VEAELPSATLRTRRNGAGAGCVSRWGSVLKVEMVDEIRSLAVVKTVVY